MAMLLRGCGAQRVFFSIKLDGGSPRELASTLSPMGSGRRMNYIYLDNCQADFHHDFQSQEFFSGMFSSPRTAEVHYDINPALT